MKPWVLVTGASEEHGLGHLSRMCGLAQALAELGERTLLYVSGGSIQHLRNTVPAEEVAHWLDGLTWAVRDGDGIPTWIEQRPLDSYFVFDTPNDLHWNVPWTAMVTDFGPVDGANPDAYICPHETAWLHHWPPNVAVLGGAQYQPLRRPYWTYRSVAREEEGAQWADPRTAHPSDVEWPRADRAVCMVGVRMYEAIAYGMRVAVVARDEREAAVARAAGVAVVPDGEPNYSHIEVDTLASGASNLACRLQEVMRA